MTRIRFVDRKDFEHRAVIFPQIAFDLPPVPFPWWRTDGIFARSPDVERRSGVEIGNGIAAEEFGHLNDPASVRLGETNDFVRRNEGLDLVDGAADVGNQVSEVPWSSATTSRTRFIRARGPRHRREEAARRERSFPKLGGQSRPSPTRPGSPPAPPPRGPLERIARHPARA